MILNNVVNARTFIYCSAYWSPHETSTYHNSSDGHYHQYIYFVHGKGLQEHSLTRDGEVMFTIPADVDMTGQLHEISEFKDRFTTITTLDDPWAVVHFNPVPATRNLSVELVTQEHTTIDVETHDLTIVCITGSIEVNGKTLKSLQHARVRKGATVVISKPPHAVCVTVSHEKLASDE